MGAYGPPPGFYKSERRVRINAMYCVGCMKCLAVCPRDEVISAGKAQGKPFAYVKRVDRCAGCARCVNACLTNAISLYWS